MGEVEGPRGRGGAAAPGWWSRLTVLKHSRPPKSHTLQRVVQCRASETGSKITTSASFPGPFPASPPRCQPNLWPRRQKSFVGHPGAFPGGSGGWGLADGGGIFSSPGSGNKKPGLLRQRQATLKSLRSRSLGLSRFQPRLHGSMPEHPLSCIFLP